MSHEKDSLPTTSGIHGVPGDEAVAAKEALPATAAIVMESKSPENEAKEDYNSQPEEKAGLRYFWRILSYATRLDMLLMGAATVCAAGAGVTLPLMNVVFGNLVGSFTGYFTPGVVVSEADFLQGVNQNSLYIVYLFIAKFGLAYVSMFSFRMVGIRVSAAVRLAYLDALFAQPISVLDKMPQGKPTDLITNSANLIQLGVSDKLALLVQSIALVVGAYVVAFKYSWQLTLVSSSCMLFIILVYSVLTPLFIKAQHSVEHADEKASAVASDVFGSIRTILSLGAEYQMSEKYASWVKESQRRMLKISPIVSIQFSPIFFAMYCNFALTFWFGLKLYRDGILSTVGTVITVFFSVILVITALGNIASPLMGISKASSAAVGFFAVIDSPGLPRGGLRDPDVSSNENIVFENVTFAYPSRPQIAVLKELNLEFEAEKTTAIVGPSGCGKSTIVALLERWYRLAEKNVAQSPPKEKKDAAKEEGEDEKNLDMGPVIANQGSIRIGRTELEEVDSKWWRSQIGLVQQEPFLFNDTLYKNVAFGLIGSQWENEDEKVKRAMVEEACKEAFADEFVQRLPERYDTKVGESGIKLSGGQRQRIAIARSIIKKPRILILDEATSSIDVHGERIVQAALDRVSQGRTTIMIAHRLSTIKKADHIVVMKDGTMVEHGTHETLLANPEGVYHNLVNAQRLEIASGEDESAMRPDELPEKALLDPEDLKVEEASDDDEQPETTSYKPRGFVASVGLFLYEQRRHYFLYILVVIGAMIAGAAYPLQSYIFAKIIDVFAGSGQELVDAGNFWALMFFVLALCVLVAYILICFSLNHLATYVSTTYRQEYFENILQKPIAFYDEEDNSSGQLTSRLSTDSRQLQELLGPNLAFPLIAVFNMVGSVILSFVIGWKLTLVIACSATPVIIAAAFIRLRFELQFVQLNEKVFTESSKFAAETIRAFRTVTSLTLEDTILTRYDALLREHVSKAFKKAWKAAFVFALSDSIELPCMALGFWYGGQLMASREYDVVQFLVIYSAIVQGGQAAGQFFSIAPNMAQATAAANRILSLRPSTSTAKDYDSSPDNGGSRPPSTTPTNQSAAQIDFDSISFKYSTRPNPIFSNFNLHIPAGNFIAFVGPSGCGKTTIVSLLERFYVPQSGRILFNSSPVASIPPRRYRTNLSLVSQEPHLFEGSVRSNLLLGLDSKSIPNEDIEAACAAAEIHSFITSLPESYATPLSGTGAGHASLSGGQKQRLCIARALLRKPKLLLLDEATSSLDSQSEGLVQAAIERLAKGRDMTIVVVAHRLATVQKADTVVVLGEGGKVVEEGSHKELVDKKGVYWGMCKGQALDR